MGSGRTLLVLRALGLGDLLVAVPALRALRRHWPEHRLVLATAGWLAPIVPLITRVDQIRSTAGLAEPLAGVARPDIAVNLHGSGPRSTELLEELAPGRRIGHRAPGWPGPEWIEQLPERVRWCRLVQAHGVAADPGDLRLTRPAGRAADAGAVLVNPGVAAASRRWPVARFAAVAAALARDGHRVLVVGAASDRDRATAVAEQAGLPADRVLAGRTDLAELAVLAAGARLVVTADTGLAHLCYAFGTPAVVIFGPAPAWRWGPPPGGPQVACSADALRRGDPFASTPDPALLGVSAPTVLAAARRLLSAA